ncbi:DUF370 domain protein [Desulfitobacterium hafniense]|uniref:DUF370 domain protein n=1 Tax=Desulfitobacterium hafniense TaxID=49338 RepID=A0A098AXF1_DESHA|nr:extracellular matrix/biofilm biosynthesis regulator RemA family protein [Desulfitobacterium hafniense]CDX01278.1 DUF370 domain protein [Desulfitobacterium hafniense]
MLKIGHGNSVNENRIIAIVSPDSNPIKRMIHAAADDERLIEATMGRRTRAVIVMDSGHVVTSSVGYEILAGRLGGVKDV